MSIVLVQKESFLKVINQVLQKTLIAHPSQVPCPVTVAGSTRRPGKEGNGGGTAEAPLRGLVIGNNRFISKA